MNKRESTHLFFSACSRTLNTSTAGSGPLLPPSLPAAMKSNSFVSAVR